MKIPAITVWQPWASLIVCGIKTVENRPWKPPLKIIGEWIAIHAGRAVDRHAMEFHFDNERVRQSISETNPFPKGVLLGIAFLSAFYEPAKEQQIIWKLSDLEWWEREYFGWVFRRPRILKNPISTKGRQGIWYAEIPEEINPG